MFKIIYIGEGKCKIQKFFIFGVILTKFAGEIESVFLDCFLNKHLPLFGANVLLVYLGV